MSYDFGLFNKASELSYYWIKALDLPKTNDNFEHYAKLAIMFLKSKKDLNMMQFFRKYDSPELKKLNLWDNFLVL